MTPPPNPSPRMTAFTDEMLKEIKNGMSTLRMTMDVKEYSLSTEWLEGLIERLEAAESGFTEYHGLDISKGCKCRCCTAWLKSAGREGR